ncbi:MAG: divalent-cation tolerance protein CutA [Deltaproteobacteria bacterium]|nr:divalent-cation tolerance protein CutA [Deltaproteobacteria bacterium]
MGIRFVYITTNNEEEAARIGKELVVHRLAACANIIKGLRSFYWWEGEVQDDSEALLIAKTREELMPQLIHKVKELHTYTCPCIVSLPIMEGNPDFIVQETSEG